MPERSGLPVLTVLVFRCLLGVSFPFAPVGDAQAVERPAWRMGQDIYRHGATRDGPPVTARLRDSDTEFPARGFACANCHGGAGQGGTEAGQAAPAIDAATLARDRQPQGGGLARPAYDAASLVRALTQGLDAAGVPFGPAMPRYRMSEAQLEALSAYLAILGTAQDLDPGLDATSVTVGTALPLSGPLAATGSAIAALLRASFEEVNAGGGIYGRKLALIVEDTGTAPAGALEATRRLVDDHGVFALLASADGSGDAAFDALLAWSAVPSIAPIGRVSRETGSSAAVWRLLPTPGDQARVLVDYLVSAGQGPRIALLHGDGPEAQDAVRGARAQLAMYGAAIVTDRMFPESAGPNEAALQGVVADPPPLILLFGDDLALRRLAARLRPNASSRVTLAGLAGLSPGLGLALPRQVDLVLAYPSDPAAEADWAEHGAAHGSNDGGASNPALRALVHAAAKVLQEGLLRSGRRLSRETLKTALDGLRDFRSGALPPIAFSPTRRIGLSGASIVQRDAAAQRYALKWSWRLPRGGH